MNNNIIVIGSSNTDMVIRADRLPQVGETILGEKFIMNQGGKGANQAIAVARLGGNVHFVCNVGDDLFGQNTIKMLRNEGIDTNYVNVMNGKSSGVALINVDAKGENTIVVASGANGTLSINDIKKAENEIKRASIILMQLETPINALSYAAKLAKENNVKVVLNPAPIPKEVLPEELIKNVDILIPNKIEAEMISGIKINDDNSLLDVMRKIASIGISIIIITMGPDGAVAYENDKMFHIPAYRVNAIDTTAAGDTFCGALCTALANGDNLKDAISFANKASSISVTRMGAQASIPYKYEIKL